MLTATICDSDTISNVFDGAFTEKNFGSWLSNVFTLETYNLKDLVDPSTIGVHSWRKGYQSHALNGSTAGPNTATVFLRAGTKLGQPHQRYVYQQAAGDSYAGRIASGLDVNSATFMTLPAHFKEITNDLRGVIRSIIPGYDKYPECFRTVMPYLIASVVFHSAYLIDTLPTTHALFRNKLFRDNIYLNMPEVVTGRGKCLLSGMTATGIPPHVVILDKFEVHDATLAAHTASIVALTQEIRTLREAMVGNGTVGGVPIVDLNSTLGATLNSFRDDMVLQCRAVVQASSQQTVDLVRSLVESTRHLSITPANTSSSSVNSNMNDTTTINTTTTSSTPPQPRNNAYLLMRSTAPAKVVFPTK